MEYEFKGLRKSIYDEEPLRLTLQGRLGLSSVEAVRITREAIDARHKHGIVYVYNVRFRVARRTERLEELLSSGEVRPYLSPALPSVEPHILLEERPIIVGFGPAGIFCALWLARRGYRPIVFERGPKVPDRVQAVETLWSEGRLDPEANLQFGEGGAGTFSDGKLTTGKASALDRTILETFVEAGAPEDILYSFRPHVGTDRLRRLVVQLRRHLEGLGVEIHFRSKLSDVVVADGAVQAVTVEGQRLPARDVILAIGHSARRTLEMLRERGVAMVPKPFAVGTRIEHPANFIDEAQYGQQAAQVLPPASYRLTHRYGRFHTYSFCMCPGGYVVCASSERGGQVTNGMSRYARAGDYSNAALVVNLQPDYVGFEDALDGMFFQRHLEQRAYELGGGDFHAPAQRAADFLEGQRPRELRDTTYRPGVRAADLEGLFPTPVVLALKSALRRWDRIMPGFVEKGLLLGVESRTSSPVRILRDENCRSTSIEGLYLLGEGSGYAGGIMTCARDAVRFARAVVPRG